MNISTIIRISKESNDYNLFWSIGDMSISKTAVSVGIDSILATAGEINNFLVILDENLPPFIWKIK